MRTLIVTDPADARAKGMNAVTRTMRATPEVRFWHPLEGMRALRDNRFDLIIWIAAADDEPTRADVARNHGYANTLHLRGASVALALAD